MKFAESHMKYLRMMWNIHNIIEREKVNFGNFLLSNLRNSELEVVSDADLRNHEFYRSKEVCENLVEKIQIYKNKMFNQIPSAAFDSPAVSQSKKNMKVVKYEDNGNYFSVQIQDGSIKTWIDVSIENEDAITEWNSNYASTNLDDKTKKYEDNSDNFDKCSSAAINYLESENKIHQDKKGKWYLTSDGNTIKNEAKKDKLEDFLKLAELASEKGLIDDVIDYGEEFSFYLPGDKCDVTISKDDHGGFAMTQDYNDGNVPDTDDIDMKTFRKYIGMENVNESISRITAGAETIYELNDDKPKHFASSYAGGDVDIFFTKDDKYAIVTNRLSNIVHHGKNGGKDIKSNNIKFVYCGPEDDFYDIEGYKLMLKAIHGGKRYLGKPLLVNESKTYDLEYTIPVPMSDIARNVDELYLMTGDEIFDKAKKYLSIKARKHNCKINVKMLIRIDSGNHKLANAYFVCDLIGKYEDMRELVGYDVDGYPESDATNESSIVKTMDFEIDIDDQDIIYTNSKGIEFSGTMIKSRHDVAFEPNWFSDDKSEKFWDENWEELSEQIKDFYTSKINESKSMNQAKYANLEEILSGIKNLGGKRTKISWRKGSYDEVYEMPDHSYVGITRSKEDGLILTIDIDSNGEGYNHFMSDGIDKNVLESKSTNQAKYNGLEVELPNTNIILVDFKYDINGNRTIGIKYPNSQKFSIQTNNGILNSIEKTIRDKGLDGLNEKDLIDIEKTLVEYIKSFGSKKQKDGLRTYSGFNESVQKYNKSQDIKKIWNFVDSFPSDAKNWRDATEEIRDIYVELRDLYNEFMGSDIDIIDWNLLDKKTVTPSKWNSEYKKGIQGMLELIKKSDDNNMQDILTRTISKYPIK